MTDVKGFGRLTEQQVAEFERAFGLSLPDDYRAFLMKHNGGVPDRNRFLIPDVGSEALVQYFVGLDTNDAHDLVDWLNKYRAEMPAHFVIIGKDPGGNLLTLGCQGSERPGVYYWDHTYWFPQSSDEENTYFLSPSLSEFLAALQPADE